MTFVQRWRADGAAASTTIGVTINPTAGNTLIITVTSEANTAGNPTCSDGGTGVTNRPVNYADGNLFAISTWYRQSVPSGSRTLTVTLPTSRANRSIVVEEHSGLGTFIAATNSGTPNMQNSPTTGAGATTTGNVNITSQPAWIIGWSMNWGAGTPAPSASNGNNNGTIFDYGGADYGRMSDRRVTATGNAALTFTAGSNVQHYSVGIAFVEAASGPDVTDVDTDEIITSTQTNVVATGTGFNSAAVTIIQGSTTVTQSIDSQDSTTIQFDVVFDSGATDLRYGAATLRVTNTGGANDSISITIAAPSGRSYVDLTTPNTTAANRITAVADLASGDQLEISNVVGGTITDVTVNTDATFDVAEGVTAFDVRAWDASDSTWGTAGTQTVGDPVITLTVQNAAHGHTASTPTLSTSVTLTVQNARHGHAAQSPALVQAHTLAVNSARHTHTAATPTLTQANTLSVANARHDHAAQSVTLTQGNQLTVANARHGHAAQSPALVQAHTLAVNSARHTHTATTISLSQGLTLAVANALHAHAAQSPSLVQANVLNVANARHTHSAQSPTLSTAFTLSVNNARHGHAASNLTLISGNALLVNSARHGHLAQSVALTQASTLSVANARHVTRAQSPTLSLAFSLNVANARHGHAAQSPTLSTILMLNVATARHLHFAASPTLIPIHVILSVQSCRHAHSAQSPTILQQIDDRPLGPRAELNYMTDEARRFGARSGTRIRTVYTKTESFQVKFARQVGESDDEDD